MLDDISPETTVTSKNNPFKKEEDSTSSKNKLLQTHIFKSRLANQARCAEKEACIKSTYRKKEAEVRGET